MTYDEWLEKPYQDSARLAEAFSNWFEINSEWLQAEYEEIYEEVCDEKDMKKFKTWAEHQYDSMMRAI